jgi:hypothetical protein
LIGLKIHFSLAQKLGAQQKLQRAVSSLPFLTSPHPNSSFASVESSKMAWEVKRDSAGTKFMFCYVSGGYVMIGTREKNNPLNTSSDSCYVEEFSTHNLQNAIKSVCLFYLQSTIVICAFCVNTRLHSFSIKHCLFAT